MVADDSAYRSWIARIALPIVMVAVMFWIRAWIPDEVTAAGVMPVQSATAADIASAQSIISTPRNIQTAHDRQTVASVSECVRSAQRTLSNSSCGSGAMAFDLGPRRVNTDDAGAVR